MQLIRAWWAWKQGLIYLYIGPGWMQQYRTIMLVAALAQQSPPACLKRQLCWPLPHNGHSRRYAWTCSTLTKSATWHVWTGLVVGSSFTTSDLGRQQLNDLFWFVVNYSRLMEPQRNWVAMVGLSSHPMLSRTFWSPGVWITACPRLLTRSPTDGLSSQWSQPSR